MAGNTHSTPSSDPITSAFKSIALTVIIGVILATMFTLWTPTSILPAGASQQIAIAAATQISGQNGSAILRPTPLPTAEKPRIGLVSGHLGNDSGAICPDGLTEAQINFDVATRVKANLEQQGFEVDILDEFDNRLNGYRAEALVSIHADSCVYINDLATGFKVTGSLESLIPPETERLVACLTDRYGRRTGMFFHANSITYDMTYYHAYREIAPETPAAIIELGFMNLDRDILTNHPDVVALGVTEGILCYVYGEPISGN